MQGENDDGLADLSGLEKLLHKVNKGRGGCKLEDRGGRGDIGGVGRAGYRMGSRTVGGNGGSEPEITNHLAGLFCDEAGGTFERGIKPVDEMGRVIGDEGLGQLVDTGDGVVAVGGGLGRDGRRP